MPPKKVQDTSSIDPLYSNPYKRIYPPTRSSTRGQPQLDTPSSSTVPLPREPIHPSALRTNPLFSPPPTEPTSPRTPKSSPHSREPSPEPMGDQVAIQPTLRSQFIPLNTVPEPVVVVPVRENAEKFKLSHSLRAALPTFHGLPAEEPYEHIANFDQLMLSMNEHIYGQDVLRLTLFPSTLQGNAQLWLRSLQPGSITTWQEMYKEFLLKYFPHTKTNALKTQI